MANIALKIVTRPTFRDLQGRFAKAEQALLDAKRDELRDEGRYLVQQFKDNLRAKIGENKLENAIRFNTRQVGDNVRLSVTAPGHARPHRIAARNASALAFNWQRVGMMTFVPRRGGFRTHVRNGQLWVGKGYVNHPGGSLEPLIVPILQRTSDEWTATRGRRVLQRMTTRYTQELTR